MLRQLVVLAAATVVSLATAVTPVHAAPAPLPGRITVVRAQPGPGPGQVTFSWRQEGAHATRFRIETGLSAFSPYSTGLPDHGRGTHYFHVGGRKRSVTLSPAQLAAAGAPLGSANHLYYRFRAERRSGSRTTVRNWPHLQSVSVQPPAAPRSGTPLRVASFNVLSAQVEPDVRPWLQRAPLVAKAILDRRPGVVALQELGIGRADGLSGLAGAHTRQTESLEEALRARGGGRYRLVRAQPYPYTGSNTGMQGARILYDSRRYRLVSDCPEVTADGRPSASCTVRLPLVPQEAPGRRWAAYAVLEDRSTGQRFFFVSVHLFPQHSTSLSVERDHERLRAREVRTVMARVEALNTGHLPVVIAGDLNSRQNNVGGYRAHDALVNHGYFDTAAAAARIRLRWSTFNGLRSTVQLPRTGWGSRLDAITVKGIRAAARFQNVMAVTDRNRPSDHNMVLADIRLP